MNIKEVSKKFNISAQTLRYYEEIGLIPKVHRDSKGYRDYSEQDLQWVYYAKALRKAGVSIESMIKYIALVQDGENTRELRREILIEQEEKLANTIKDMQETLDYLRLKIKSYDNYILSYEKQLLKNDNKNNK